MTRTRILHVLYRMGTGGTELALQRLTASLDPRQFENIICTVTPKEKLYGPQPPSAATAESLQAGKISTDSNTEQVRYITLGRTERKPGFLVPSLTRIFRRERPDVVHSRNWGAIEAVLAAKLAGVPRVIHSEHGRDIHTMHGDPLRRRIFRRFCYALADEVFAVSSELRHHYSKQLRIPAERIKVIANGVDANRFQPDAPVRSSIRKRLGVDDNTVVVGTVGRLDPVKDQLTLLRAANQLIGAGIRLHVVLVGDGPEGEKLRGYVDTSLMLRPHVTFVGESNKPEAWLNSFDVFVLPSVSEGMSNTVLEAMATGLPCVVTRVGANPELVEEGKTGFLANPGSSTGIAERIARLAEDSQLRQKMGAQGRLKVTSHFSFERMIENYSELYAASGSISKKLTHYRVSASSDSLANRGLQPRSLVLGERSESNRRSSRQR